MTDEPEAEGLADELTAIASWGDPGRVPALDTVEASRLQDVSRATPARRRAWRLVAACAAVISVLAGTAAVIWTRDDGGTDVAGPPHGTADDAGPATCADIDRFEARMSNLGITYDYDPSDSAASLGSAADVVVQGELTSIREVETELDSFVVFGFLVRGASNASVLTGEEIEVSIAFGPASVSFSEIADAFTPGISAVLFLSSSADRPGGWSPTLEGVWVSCGESERARSARIRPVNWSHNGTLADLFAEAIGDQEDPISGDVAPAEPPYGPAPAAGELHVLPTTLPDGFTLVSARGSVASGPQRTSPSFGGELVFETSSGERVSVLHNWPDRLPPVADESELWEHCDCPPPAQPGTVGSVEGLLGDGTFAWDLTPSIQVIVVSFAELTESPSRPIVDLIESIEPVTSPAWDRYVADIIEIAGPSVGDEWHIGFAVYICGAFLEPPSGASDEQGFSVLDGGVFRAAPTDPEVTGGAATVDLLLELAEIKPLELAASAECATSANTDISLWRWDASTLEQKSEVWLTSIGDAPINADNELWTIAITEQGDLDIPPPPAPVQESLANASP